MSQKIDSILIFGATGNVGPQAAKVFQDAGFEVYGTTRSVNSEKSKALMASGVKMRAASLDDSASIEQAMSGVDGVFVITPSAVGYDDAGFSKIIFDAAEASSLKHLVYLSYLSADPNVGYEKAPKQKTENYIRENLKVPWTIIRSVDFMENFNTIWKDSILKNGIGDPKDEDYPRQFIAAEDIAGFASRAFQDTGKWSRGAVNMVGDQMPNVEVSKVLSKVMGREVPHTKITWENWANDYKIPPPVVDAFKWYNKTRLVADLADMRAKHPELQTLESFLRETGWENMA